MSPEVSISQWGNSQGLRIPKSIVEALQINVGDSDSLSQECVGVERILIAF